ncbi:MAG: Stp1/IreP family PP2C-type Ser/Thr phosphatase [Oscillospiraceae bacterium]|nr:Stp1/IreP family PP2C-type Ser/Thr phosphatase [Oscillospiraceae bacterium]
MMIFSSSEQNKRAENQDSFAWQELEGAVFAVVCDGMGGENAGKEASSRSIEIIMDRIVKAYRPEMDHIKVKQLMMAAVKTANAVIYELGSTIPECYGMGTTCVAALIRDNKAYIINVGDSRAYLITHEIVQVTKDHSMVQDLLDNGDITLEEVKNHPKRNVITKAVGVDEDIEPDFYERKFPDGAAMILCSDGLYNFCDAGQMFRIIKDNDTVQSAEALVQIALENEDSADNITAVVIRS